MIRVALLGDKLATDVEKWLNRQEFVYLTLKLVNQRCRLESRQIRLYLSLLHF